MYANVNKHDYEQKQVLGETFVAGQTPMQDVDQAIDLLFNHSNTPKFIAELLIKRFTISNPRRPYVRRVAEAFEDNGLGVRGDLFAVIKAILLDSDVINGYAMEDNQHYGTGKKNFGKVKEPIVVMANMARALNMHSNYDERWWDYLGTQSNFGQAPLRSPSVFNFYLPDYAPKSVISDVNLTAPEFAILTSDVMRKLSNKLWDVIWSSRYTNDLRWTWDREDFEQVHKKPNEYVALINDRFFGGLISTQLTIQIKDILAYYPEEAIDKRIVGTLFVVQSSPEFRCQE